MSITSDRRGRGRSRRLLIQGALLISLGAILFALAGAAVAWRLDDSGKSRPLPSQAEAMDVVPIPVDNVPQVAAGVRVAEPAVDRGKLPLNTTVQQAYELVNTGPVTASFGRPTIEVLDGCCPPQPQLSQSTLAPGGKAVLAMSMQMHEGMDGPHLYHLTVPVQSAGTAEALHLYFKGDFGG